MPGKTSKSPSSIYQLKITLRGFRPPIWRRVLVPGKFDLFKLHRVIQIAMGWTDDHLHQFIVGGEYYSLPNPDDWTESENEEAFTLETIAPQVKSKFEYEYDFGDSWSHQIAVEKIVPAEPGEKYPQCIKGKRACPPEDVGGVWGYAEFLEAIQDPDHEEHDSYLEWIGEDSFDPEAFDLEEVNLALKGVK